jgi:hypothetical protein
MTRVPSMMCDEGFGVPPLHTRGIHFSGMVIAAARPPEPVVQTHARTRLSHE